MQIYLLIFITADSLFIIMLKWFITYERYVFQRPAHSCLLLACFALSCWFIYQFPCHLAPVSKAKCIRFSSLHVSLVACMMGFSSTFVVTRPASERGTPKHPLPQLLSRSRRQSAGCAQCLLLLTSNKFTEYSTELTDVYTNAGTPTEGSDQFCTVHKS